MVQHGRTVQTDGWTNRRIDNHWAEMWKDRRLDWSNHPIQPSSYNTEIPHTIILKKCSFIPKNDIHKPHQYSPHPTATRGVSVISQSSPLENESSILDTNSLPEVQNKCNHWTQKQFIQSSLLTLFLLHYIPYLNFFSSHIWKFILFDCNVNPLVSTFSKIQFFCFPQCYKA